MEIKHLYKSFLSFIFALPVIFLLSGCNGGSVLKPPPSENTPLFEYIGPKAIAFAENFYTDFPVSVSVRHDTIASGVPSETRNPDTIEAVFTALKEMRVTDYYGDIHTDDYLVYTFKMADGSQYSFEFQAGHYLDNDTKLLTVMGFDRLEAALSAPSPDNISIEAGSWYKRGNDANGSWVFPWSSTIYYIGTEYGLYRLSADDKFYQYTSYPADSLSRYGNYIIYTEYSKGYANGRGLRAFDTMPLSEPYPTETLYNGALFCAQFDAANNVIYFLANSALHRVKLAPLMDSSIEFQPEAISSQSKGWQPVSDLTSDLFPVPPPPEAPISLAASPEGVYVSIGRAGYRYDEFVNLYDHGGKTSKKVNVLSDIACRGMFWVDPIQALLFRYDAQKYGSERADAKEGSSGIYALKPDGEIIRLHDDGKSDFSLWWDLRNVSEESFPVFLITAGGVNNGSRRGVHKIDISGETPGDPVCLYDGPASAPNIANGYVYFRAPSESQDAKYDYFRVPVDGSSGVERLDFKNRIIERR